MIFSKSFVLRILMGCFLPDTILASIYYECIESSWLQLFEVGMATVGFTLIVVYLTVMKPVRANPTDGLSEEQIVCF